MKFELGASEGVCMEAPPQFICFSRHMLAIEALVRRWTRNLPSSDVGFDQAKKDYMAEKKDPLT